MGGSRNTQSPAANAQARIAQQLINQTDPLRRNLIGRSQNFLEGNLDVTATPMFRDLKGGVETSFNNARTGIIGDVAPGGALTQALVDLEDRKARTLTGGIGQIAGNEQANAMSLATGQANTGLAGLGQAGQIQAAALQADAQRDAGIFGGLGAGAGAFAGLKAAAKVAGGG